MHPNGMGGDVSAQVDRKENKAQTCRVTINYEWARRDIKVLN